MNRAVPTVNGVVYGLSQFHFHAPSEHTVAGRHAMELHAVFADPPPDNKAVVAIVRHRQPNACCRVADARFADEER